MTDHFAIFNVRYIPFGSSFSDLRGEACPKSHGLSGEVFPYRYTARLETLAIFPNLLLLREAEELHNDLAGDVRWTAGAGAQAVGPLYLRLEVKLFQQQFYNFRLALLPIFAPVLRYISEPQRVPKSIILMVDDAFMNFGGAIFDTF